MKINMNIGLQGHYRIVVSKDAEMKEIVQDTGFFENIITDAGLHALASYESNATTAHQFRTNFFKEFYLGSGTTTPTADDTSLENLGATGTGFEFFNRYSKEDPKLLDFGDSLGVTIKKEFGKGAFVGVLSEVGLGVTDSNILFSRALILNEDEIPLPITVTENDYLTVYYTVRQYIPFPKTFNITADIKGIPTPMEVRVQPWSKTDEGGEYEYFDIHAGRNTIGGNSSYFRCEKTSSSVDDFQKTINFSYNDYSRLSFTPYDATNKPFESWGKLELGENDWNATIKTVTILGLPGSWQLRFTPEIVKKFGEKMEIEFGVRLGRYEGSQGLDDN